MDRPKPQLHQSVDELLNTWPETASVFLGLKTTCVGCYLARFCTLADVAATYDLTTDYLIEKMELASQISITTINTGENHENQ